MVWFRRASPTDTPITTVEFSHPSGNVVLREVDGRVIDDVAEIRGLVDDDTWERIQRHDIFGAASRSRSAGSLPSTGSLRLTLTTNLVLPEEATVLPTEGFVIIDAMRAVDAEELKAAGLEGEVWEGLHFSGPHPWAAAVTELVGDGFDVLTSDEQSTVLRHDADIVVVEFRRRADVRLVQIVVSSPLALGDDIPLALYEAINGINVVVPWSTTMIDDGDVLVRETVADEVVDQGALIATRVQEMLGLLFVMRGPLADVAHGDMTPQQSLDNMFG